MPLFHFSENGSIEVFHPRAPEAHPETPPFVWAIDEWHSPLYFLPRDCPRVCFWPIESTSEIDLHRFWSGVTGRIVVAIEKDWLQRVRETTLFCYTFEETGFVATGDHGVHCSRNPVTPVKVESLKELDRQILDAGVELRICPSLVPLGEALIDTTLHWSLIRMRNAQDWRYGAGKPTLPPE